MVRFPSMVHTRTRVDLSASVASLRSVGARTVSKLERLGIATVRQLLWHVPSRYDDFRESVPVSAVQAGVTVSLLGTVSDVSSRQAWRNRRMTVTEAVLSDDTGTIRLVWFNQSYLAETLTSGTVMSVAGKVRVDKRGLFLSGPVFEKVQGSDGNLRHTGRLVPVYPETAGMTSKFLRYLIQPILGDAVILDYLPEEVRSRRCLPELSQALRMLHYPDRQDDIEVARRRLAFDDLLLFQIRALLQRRVERTVRAVSVPFQETTMREVVQSLPWTLTRDQKVVLLEVLRDMERAFPMNRLVQGDVGSGKTAVALCACMQVAQHRLQSVFLAPTETLAQQHYETARKILGTRISGIVILTGTQAQVDGRDIDRVRLKRDIRAGIHTLVIGTHAVIQKDVQFGHLALVVVDEQHRFGIEQRAALIRGRTEGGTPHLLTMTATPIPRTLALTVFGDLDISTIRMKPQGRIPVSSAVVQADRRGELEERIRQETGQGRQVFIICPAIQAPDVSDGDRGSKGTQTRLALLQMKAVQEEYERLAEGVFSNLKIAMLHGKMRPKEKRAVMTKFKDGWYDILVSTSVIEVGVDVPNATVMVIENADRFGLAQLHQFRGRVGRSSYQSWCFVVPSSDALARKRLDAFIASSDGFELAEQDLKLRGPGEFFGIKQSGMPDLTMSALADVELVQEARQEARQLLQTDTSLKRHPLLRAQLRAVARLMHGE